VAVMNKTYCLTVMWQAVQRKYYYSEKSR